MSNTPGKRFREALAAESPLQVIGAINANHALLAKRAGSESEDDADAKRLAAIKKQREEMQGTTATVVVGKRVRWSSYVERYVQK